VAIGHLSVQSHQVFLTTVPDSGPITIRAQVGRNTSVAWTQPGAACPHH
jgi:hypothetical protein